MEIESREKVKRLLRELFQFDAQDLDFGIYRIMNFKRDAIEKFIEKDLLEAAETEFKEYAKVGVTDLQKEIESLKTEINRDFGAGTIDEQGHVVKHEDAPKIQQYLSKLKELESAQVTQAQIDDVFNHIYEFFSRYYDKGDFIPKRRYGGKEKYYVPYNGEEVLLYWATADQYYVKTGEYFKRYGFKAGAYRVNFVLKEAEIDSNNAKGGNRYFLLHEPDIFKLDEDNRELDIHFKYRELTEEEEKKYGRGNVQDKITSGIVDKLFSKIRDTVVAAELRKKAAKEELTILEQHIKKYVTRNTTDYFIHKNLKYFLERELEFYLKNEVLDLDEIEHMDERNIRLNKAKIRAIKEIGNKIINFLAQIEDFQRRLFEKKKFIVHTDYCVTLDRVPKELYNKILENKRQIEEWVKIYAINKWDRSLHWLGEFDKAFLENNPHLMIDTAFFDEDFKIRLLESFDNLDEAINGVLIHGENFQALNLLKEKYKEQIKCIYIDPPYNTGNDEFLYKDSYRHSSWLSMLAERLNLAKRLMNVKGVFFTSIDDHEESALHKLFGDIFGSENLLPTVVIRRRKSQPNLRKGVAPVHDFLKIACIDYSVLPQLSYIPEEFGIGSFSNPDNDPRGPWTTGPCSNQGGSRYKIETPSGVVYDDEWRFTKETYESLLKDGRIYFPNNGKGKPRYKIYLNEKKEVGITPSTWWDDVGTTQDSHKLLENLFGFRCYDNPKPVELLERIVDISTNAEDLVLDFFAGSATTAHAVLNLNSKDGGNRKYILVEMGDYVYTVMKSRIQKVVFSSEWKDGVPQNRDGQSHMFKYMCIEQYEDTLNNIVFISLDKTVQETLESFGDYFVRYMLDYETRDSPTRLMLDKFQTPFDYKIKISKNGEKEEYVTVDLVETFNYLLGLWVEKLRVFKDGERVYRVVIGKRGNDKVVVIWRNTKDLDLESDKKFIEENILSVYEANTVYINRDSYVKNAQPIEPLFKELMGA